MSLQNFKCSDHDCKVDTVQINRCYKNSLLLYDSAEFQKSMDIIEP